MPRPLLYAIMPCILAVIAEALLMGQSGSEYVKSLKQPSIAPPQWAWAPIGLAYYLICVLTLYRLFAQETLRAIPIVLVLAVLAANAFWNYIYFRRHDLRAVFWYSVAYSGLVLVLIPVLLIADRVAALAFSVYAAYLPYALAVFYRTWKLNA